MLNHVPPLETTLQSVEALSLRACGWYQRLINGGRFNGGHLKSYIIQHIVEVTHIDATPTNQSLVVYILAGSINRSL